MWIIQFYEDKAYFFSLMLNFTLNYNYEDKGGSGLVAELYLTLATPGTLAHQAPLSMGFHNTKPLFCEKIKS